MIDRARKLAVFPAFHKVAGRRVVVVGGGVEAATKIRLLAETRAEIVVFAEALDRRTGADLVAAHGDWRGRWPTASDLAGAALVFVATGSEESDRAIWSRARQAGVPVNVVDRPELCDFYTPAIVNRAPLAVAIGSEGAAPVLSRHIRARIEALLAPAFGDLAGLADRLRARVAATLRSPGARRRFWAGFFSGAIAEKVFAGRIEEAEDEAIETLNTDRVWVGHVSLVGAGPGAEDLITLRAQRALQEADVIVYDRLVPDAIVAEGRRDARRVYVGKAKGAHVVTQDEINALIVREARCGHRVVRLKSGDPLVFGRAGEEMAALRAAGISFDVVPGITAAFAAAAECEIPLTLRDHEAGSAPPVSPAASPGTGSGAIGKARGEERRSRDREEDRVSSSALVFATGHDANGETLPGWVGLALAGATVAVYMGRTVAATVASRLIAAGLSASTPVAVIENASRPDRRAYTGQLDELAKIAANPALTGPVLILIGAVVANGSSAAVRVPLSELAAA